MYVFCLEYGCHSVVLRLDTINKTFTDVCSLALSFKWCKRKLCKRKVYSVQNKRVKKIIKEQYKKLGKIRYVKFQHAACKKSNLTSWNCRSEKTALLQTTVDVWQNDFSF